MDLLQVEVRVEGASCGGRVGRERMRRGAAKRECWRQRNWGGGLVITGDVRPVWHKVQPWHLQCKIKLRNLIWSRLDEEQMRGLMMDAARGDEDLMRGLLSARNPCSTGWWFFSPRCEFPLDSPVDGRPMYVFPPPCGCNLLPFSVECSPFPENHLSWSSFLLPNVKKFLSFFTVATSLFLLNGAPSCALNPPFHSP